MRKLIIIQDIDHLGFPFDIQYHKFLREIYGDGLDDKFTIEMLMEHKYIEYYLWNELEKGPKIVLETLMEWHPELSRDPKAFIDEYFYKKIREFGNSDYFVHGVHAEIREMNHYIKKRNPQARIIALTARGRVGDEDNLIDNCRAKTIGWISNENMMIDNVYMSRTADKHLVLAQILKDEDATIHDIVFFAEDRIVSLPRFMELGVRCLMLTSKNDYQKEDIEKAKAGDSAGLLHVVYSHAEIRDLGIKLFEEKMKERA